MIYLKDGNIPLNLAYDDDIVQEANSTYQLSFKFPLTDGKWNLLKREVFLLADDLHGEQEFFIFEVKKANGYVQVYAKQVATLLNYYSINTISVDRVPGQTVMTALAGSVKRPCPFTFFSDILDRHTFNESNVSVMDALVKDKHSIVGQWGGDLVRDKYQVKLLKNGGTENESLFMYKKNLSSYEESENINNLKTRLHLKKTIQGRSEGEADRVIAVTVDSPLIGQYRQIYEADIEVNDQDVTDEASLLAYGQRYFGSTLCDLVENSINLDVKGKSDVSVKMFDTVSVFHERFDMDLRLKITSYHFAPMSKRLKSIGFGKVSQSVKSTVASMVAGSVDKATGRLSASFEQKLQKEIDNANRHFDAEFDKRVESINDGIEQSKAEAEAYADNIKQQIDGQLAESDRQYQLAQQNQDRQIADVLAKATSAKEIAEQTVTDLMRVRNAFNQSIGQANTKALELERSIGTVRTDVMSQAQTILAQAQTQTELTNRVASVETTANSTKMTVSELSNTVSKVTGDIASVTSRTKTIEDNLSQTRTQYEALTQTVNAQTGQIDSINRKTADLQSGIDGVTERFENLQVGGENLLPNAGFEGAKDSSERFTVGGITYTNKTIPHWQNLYNSGIQNPTTSYHAIYRELFEGKGPVIEFNESDGSRNWKAICAVLQASNLNFGNYTFSADIYTTGVGTKVWFGFYYYNKVGVRNFHSGQTTINITTINDWHRVSGAIKLNNDIDLTKDVRFYIYAFGFTANSILYLTKPQLEEGTVATQFRLAQETLRSEIVTYKRTADEASAELSRQIQTVDGKAVDAKTYAQQTATAINTRLESLETYKNAEGTRASQYFTASRDETARQVTALRTAVTDGYVAKAKYEEDVRGVTQKFEELSSATDTKIAEHKNTVDGRFATIQASVDSKANQVDFQAVKETAQLYERIIGSTETGIKDKVARMVMADSLFLTEVKDKISGTATQVNQLSNSWAVKNLTSAGTVLNQFNLLANGTNRIDGRLTHITGQTLIDNGVINNAMIGNLDAGKITTGTLDAARIKANSIDGSKMVFDQAFVNKMTANEALFKQLFAQSAFITSVQAVTMSAGQIVGGVLKATNGAAEFDLNNAKLAFNSSATIEFNSSGNALIRKVGDVTGFLHFNNATAGGTYVGLGVTSHNEGVKSQNTGRFAGIRIFRSNDTTDQTEIYGDKIYLGHGFNGNGITITATKLSTSYELVDVINSIRALWRCWLHWNGTGWNPDDMAMRRSVINEYNTYNIG
ncbi:TPA: phage tail protein [Streptococcus suis]|uniref:Phage tail spike protein n=1 Tax=Streptococcus suis TaxID=1307 RepID=A0AAW9DFY2_STRSU|nr:phage tail spike protein [Streptococcus suis]MDX5037803.1 phage tail spike protein [Streptococcus suis]UUM58924.1 gp58-like family protein [Streptococcus suis]HEL1545488.1 phage tail protein [Streptococcus suis]HEL1552136.1 phage tail protein [Streptococcus suis]HEL2301487.1 phage tail protein [Streptococcus suis]